VKALQAKKKRPRGKGFRKSYTAANSAARPRKSKPSGSEERYDVLYMEKAAATGMFIPSDLLTSQPSRNLRTA
jgi:hypothetical protein